MITILIVLDGIHACGKSTLAEKLIQHYSVKDFNVFSTSWNSHELIHPMISKLRRNYQMKDPLVYSIAHLTEFAFRYDKQILPKLNDNYLVIADRYVLTALVRDTMRGLDEQYIKSNYSFAKPADITFILDIDSEESIRRRLISKNVYWQFGMNREYNYKETININDYKKYLSEMRNGYLKYSKDVPDCHVIDGKIHQDKIVEFCIEKINQKLGDIDYGTN